MVIDSTAKVELHRVGNAATLIAQRPPIALSITITLRELELFVQQLAQEARAWRQACQPLYYRVLGLDRDASPEAIRAAYRRLSRKLHPDVSPDTGAAMQQLNEAYEVLSDPEQREQYDLSATT